MHNNNYVAKFSKVKPFAGVLVFIFHVLYIAGLFLIILELADASCLLYGGPTGIMGFVALFYIPMHICVMLLAGSVDLNQTGWNQWPSTF